MLDFPSFGKTVGRQTGLLSGRGKILCHWWVARFLSGIQWTGFHMPCSMWVVLLSSVYILGFLAKEREPRELLGLSLWGL